MSGTEALESPVRAVCPRQYLILGKLKIASHAPRASAGGGRSKKNRARIVYTGFSRLAKGTPSGRFAAGSWVLTTATPRCRRVPQWEPESLCFHDDSGKVTHKEAAKLVDVGMTAIWSRSSGPIQLCRCCLYRNRANAVKVLSRAVSRFCAVFRSL